MEFESSPFIRWFNDIGLGDVAQVGGKNASLGEMYRELTPRGIRVPNGFAVTAGAYRHFLRESGIEPQIEALLTAPQEADPEAVRRTGQKLRNLILEAELPRDLKLAIAEAYLELGGGAPVDVAVRSSATAEDLPSASFAGQQETYLNVNGLSALLEACRKCFASLFTDRAITYRRQHGFDPVGIALSIGIQRMVRADLACAGVLFTLDTESGFRDVVLIEGAYGLGENVVQGLVNPDSFLVFKPTLKQGCEPILEKRLGSKEKMLIYDAGGGRQVRNVNVSDEKRARFCLTDDECLTLARWGVELEAHYGAKLGRPTPMDIEWAKDGATGELFIVQARPETVHSRKDGLELETFALLEKGRVLITGSSVGDRIGSGTARVIRGPQDLGRIREGDVLITAKTDPDWEPYMRKVAAIVTDQGGRTCHAAIVSRELGIPAVVGTGRGTGTVEEGRSVTVSCAEGETGKVYEGALKFRRQAVPLAEVPRPRTRILLNAADPSQAFRQSFIPNDGVGLARMEFIVTNHIRIHPMALVKYDELTDLNARRRIEELTRGYEDRKDYFVDKLAMGIGRIAAAFYPREVIVRFSDFKTNEYANLLGGRQFEPTEENPMLGFRGASRYYHPLYREGFALECRAIEKARGRMGLANVKVMVPFCRTVEEGTRVLEEMRRNGLERGKDGLEVYMMCEIPSNVILAREFAVLFDGFSIGSNDLTQLVLGVDRDSSLVAPLFDERNGAVKAMVASVIRAARESGRKVGICGQAPSDFPDFAAFLVSLGIDSISLNPDSALKVTFAVAEAEALQGKQAEEESVYG